MVRITVTVYFQHHLKRARKDTNLASVYLGNKIETKRSQNTSHS